MKNVSRPSRKQGPQDNQRKENPWKTCTQNRPPPFARPANSTDTSNSYYQPYNATQQHFPEVPSPRGDPHTTPVTSVIKLATSRGTAQKLQTNQPLETLSKVKRYKMRSTAFDAFAQNLTLENNWMVPPISLAAKSIKHLILCRAEGTLVVPKWPSSAFWSLIFNRRLESQPYVVEVLDFSSGQNIFIQGQNKNSIFGTKHFKSDILAIKMKAT
ncbi:Hypothetical predicted protein [Mytilus galloprovincialis]|uniref:Uncharacterized protein n=1 Tax=Mytilus galloprovincialis TaxID=29158 RepID=A0A8B6BY25_MYTGA|nr:Hypothetical predicted protein [Mytilus galloprovincialis]